ncbi:class I SAM-dependent methyltransferase [Serratia symbiotica]|uniref:class I SAM-dependent methyltransferase n=1 Tax=Serratia symbiotica TaxID=138074 RepID=UPI001D588910|nr:class I SAM-dependent methyltransferase [Serratia symbiotica]MCX2957378.1 class I SAM-dependent methyltransferase [Serratia symbiotica]NIG87196.1 class I SAM-dependent methyltransferase [Serratia symbiotica]USS96116.1 class I SAM-dependent methyltransferase [Serratia symbiotica]
MKDSFYSSFENKHRGSRESIKERLNAYMPFVEPLKDIYPGETILDLGCGRGEWLEMMQSIGFDGMGIDHDEGMLSYCRDLGLNVKTGDVISFLESMADESVAIVSSFHLVEHIGFYNVKRLVEESFRILKPGGLLIMETPNPENIIVSTNNFYLDPMHVAPIPSALLSFLVEHEGFERNKILRLQEDKSLSYKEDIQIIDILGGASPDYSVVAQKQGELTTLSLLDAAFDANSNYGVGLQELSTQYHQKINKLLTIRDDKISNLDDAVERLNLLVQKENTELKANLSDVYASTSWKLTAPLRAISWGVKLCIKSVTKSDFNSCLSGVKTDINRKLIFFVKRLINTLNSKPKLKGMMLKMINKIGFYGYVKKVLDKLNRQGAYNSQKSFSGSESQLSPKASAIYKALKKKKSSDGARKH